MSKSALGINPLLVEGPSSTAKYVHTHSCLYLHKVVRDTPGNKGFPLSGGGVKLQKGVLESIIQFHDGRLVATAITVVGGTEDGDHIPLVGPVVTFHHKLMCPADQSQSVGVIEVLRNVLPKGVPCPSGTDAPPTPVIGIRPEEVTHGSFVRYFLQAVQRTDVVQGVNARAEASMEGEDLPIHKRSEGEVVKQICKVLPHVGVSVLSEALIVEPIHLRDLPALMVPPQDGDTPGEAHFQRHKEGHRLN